MSAGLNAGAATAAFTPEPARIRRPLPTDVTVTAAEDDTDTTDDTDTITFTAAGGITAPAVTKAVTVTDNDTPQLQLTGSALSGNTLTVAEGASQTFKARLDLRPGSAVTVALASDNDDVTLSPMSLEFTADSWNTDQTVTVTAMRDLDTAHDTAMVSFRGAGVQTGSMTVSVTDDGRIGLILAPAKSLTVDENGEASFTVRLHAAPSADQTVTLTPSSSGITVDTDPRTAGSQTTLSFTGGSSGNWNTAQTVTVRAADDADDADDKATISLSGTDRGSEATQVSVASLSVTVIDDDKGAPPEQEEEGAALQLATIAANLVPASSSTIALRFDAPRGARTATVAGRQVALDRSLLQDLAAGLAARTGAQDAAQDRYADGRFGAERHSGDWLGGVRLEDGRPLRTGAGSASTASSSGPGALLSSFSYALGTDAAGSAGWSIWGRIDTGEFSGASDGVEFDGSQSSTWFGFDRRTDSGILSGVAYSSSSSDSDYTLGRFGAGIETDMTIVMPYMEIENAAGGSGHIMLGLVDGDATLNQTNKLQGSADLLMYMFVAGGSWPAAELGSSTLSWSGDFGFSTLKTSGSTLTALDASVSNIQLRGGVELAHNGFGEGLRAMPRIGLLLRHDAGDGITGTGVELTAGLQMLSASERLSIDLNLRALTMHSAEDLSDWGAGLQLRFNSGSGGEGFALALGPTWGAAEDDLLERDDAFRLDDADRQNRQLRGRDRGLAGSIGYGLRALGGLLTPYSEYRLTSGANGSTRQLAGLRFSNSAALELSLFSERRIAQRGEVRSRLAVELQKRY